MKRKIVHVLQVLLNQVGINATTNANLIRRKVIMITFLLFGLCSISIYPATNLNHLPTVIQGVSFTLADFANTASYLYFIAMADHNQKLLTVIDDHIYAYDDEENIKPAYEWICKEENMITSFAVVFVYLLTNVIFVTAVPLFIYLFTGKVEVMIVPAWIPTENNLLTYLSQILIILPAAITLILKWSFPLFVNFEFQRQNTRLCAALATAEQRSLTNVLKSNDERKKTLTEFSDAKPPLEKIPSSENLLTSILKSKDLEILYRRFMRRHIVQCIEHHQNLIKYVSVR